MRLSEKKLVTRKLVGFGAALLLLTGTAGGQTPQVEGLKMVHSGLLQAFESGDMQSLQARIHPQAVGFFRNAQRVTELSSRLQVKDVIPPLWADTMRFARTPLDTTYTVLGHTGIVLTTAAFKPLKNPPDPNAQKAKRPRYGRMTHVYTFEAGAWKLVAWHTSDTPVK